MALMLGKGKHGVHIVAHDMEIFRHDGMFVREHQGYLFLFLFAHGGKLCNDGKGGDGIQVMPVFDLVVEYGRAHESEQAEGCASGRPAENEFPGIGSNRGVGAVRRFQNAGGRRCGFQSQFVFLFLGQQRKVIFFLYPVFADQRGEFPRLSGCGGQALGNVIPLSGRLLEP